MRPRRSSSTGSCTSRSRPTTSLRVDAKTGRAFWVYHYAPSPAARPCCGIVNRGVAILGDTLFMATVDAHLVAIDAKNGHALWNTKLAEPAAGYAMTMAPLVVKDKVIVGVARRGIRRPRIHRRF